MKYLTPNWPAPKHIKAYTTLRSSWGASASDHTDEPSMQRLQALLNLPDKPIWLTQTHSTTVIEATPENNGNEADASFTYQPNRVCVVQTADCLPLLICNKQGTYVAAIHAGWRGLAGGIIEATLKNAPHPLNDLVIWLGPAIGPEKFEVGLDVYDAFIREHPASRAAFTPSAEGKWLANLYALARARLSDLGITEIYGGDFCTYSQQDLFFSYRHDKSKTGRMASLIWIAD